MARNDTLHRERATKAWPILVDRARAGGPPFTYKEISDLVGCHWRAAQYFLGDIQRYCDEKKLPRLQALARNANTRVPGDGYEGSTQNAAYKRELQKVYAHDWTRASPF